jgi:hypothetical protein
LTIVSVWVKFKPVRNLRTKKDWSERTFPQATAKQPALVRREEKMRERLIGIDASGTMANVVVFDMRGNELGCERQPNQMLMQHPSRTGRDAEQMRFATYRNVQSLFEKTNTEPKDISAITPFGYGGDICFNYSLIRPDAAKPDGTEFCAKGLAA